MNPSKPKTPPKGSGTSIKMIQDAKAKKKKPRIAISRKKKF